MASSTPLPIPNTDQPPAVLGADNAATPLLQLLTAYLFEAQQARKTGLNPRDDKWRDNLELYWNRYDFSKKAKWQSQAVLPEVAQYVDRFAAAMTEALSSGGDYFTVEDPADNEADITRAIKRMMDVWLGEVGRSATGTPLSFLSIFPDIIKLGAIMNCSASVTWKEAPGGQGYVAVDAFDPRELWIDHTMRGQYRIRRIEMEKSQLMDLARSTDSAGKPLYDLAAIEQLATYLNTQKTDDDRRRTGSGTEVSSFRKPIVLDEYLCTVTDQTGAVLMTNALVIVANERYIIRGPEANPHWHKRDWIVSTPLVTVPLSVYGRSFMENFGSLARLFIDLTNLIMDAVYTSSLKVFAADPQRLENPEQLNAGFSPNKVFMLGDGATAKDFIQAVDMGALSPDAVKVWEQIKSELREAASFSELGTGQFAPKGRTSSTEIMTVEQNSSLLVRDIARVVEQRLIEPILDLVWKTGLQHMKPNDKRMIAAVGQDMYTALYSRRRELVSRPLTFRCRGISRMLQKQTKLKMLLQMLGIIQQNQQLMQVFFQKVDPGKLLDQIFELADIDPDKLSLTEREKAIQQLTGGMPPGMMPGAGGPGGQPGQPGGGAPQSMPGPQGGTPPEQMQEMIQGAQ